ncbi:MFS transporter [Naasia lichenicola]|uniref:MFS transporter n=1 Tax=Naasia lichenicola TaxID=2565933 RepID=A0A4V3WT06_9MICO|nr:MFS transporter [Naasia lichenicola]THG30127.1 MFS transporter [Naasia lichenicola]
MSSSSADSVSTRPDGPSTQGAPGGYRWRWLIVAVMLAAEIMDLLDGTIVNVAGPSLEASLGSTPIGLQWVIGGYALTLGAGLILGGRLGDRFGRRRMFLLGLAGFTVASLLCALAPTIGVLIALRLVQGFAGAILLPQGLGLMRENLSGRELAAAFGIFGPVYGLGGIIGPILGGALIQADIAGLGWRSVFLVNLPIGIAALVVAWRIIPRKPGNRAITVDLVGAAIVAIASVLLVLPLNYGQSLGWPLWTWLCIAASVIGFTVFVFQQRALSARGGIPLITPSLFRKPAYTLGLGGIAIFFAGLVGNQLILTLFLQVGHQFTAGEAGLGNLPLAIGSAIGGAVSGAVLAERLGRTVLQLGPLVQLAGAVLLWFELGDGGSFSIWQIVPGVVLSGIGSGVVIAALFTVILGAVDDHEVGSASGVLTAVQSIGAAVGVAILGSLFFNTIADGSAAESYRAVLYVLGGLLVGFIVLSLFFPKKGRPEGAEG